MEEPSTRVGGEAPLSQTRGRCPSTCAAEVAAGRVAFAWMGDGRTTGGVRVGGNPVKDA